jgi:hypothetical protein
MTIDAWVTNDPANAQPDQTTRPVQVPAADDPTREDWHALLDQLGRRCQALANENTHLQRALAEQQHTHAREVPAHAPPPPIYEYE